MAGNPFGRPPRTRRHAAGQAWRPPTNTTLSPLFSLFFFFSFSPSLSLFSFLFPCSPFQLLVWRSHNGHRRHRATLPPPAWQTRHPAPLLLFFFFSLSHFSLPPVTIGQSRTPPGRVAATPPRQRPPPPPARAARPCPGRCCSLPPLSSFSFLSHVHVSSLDRYCYT